MLCLDDIRKMLTALNLDIPILIAKNYYNLLVDAQNSADKCKNCQREQAKVMSCSRSQVAFDQTMQEVYLIASGCPYAKIIRQHEKYQQLLDKLLLGRRFRNRTFDTFKQRSGTEAAYDFCKAWTKTYTPSSNGIYIFGDKNGNGKTHLAVAILLELAKTGVVGAFVVVPNYLNDLQNTFGNPQESAKLFNTYKSASVLVLDDISAIKLNNNGEASEWAREQLFMLINYRYEQLLPTIITSNCGYKCLRNILGSRIVSRIVDMTDYVENDADDYRLNKLKYTT